MAGLLHELDAKIMNHKGHEGPRRYIVWSVFV